MEVAHSCFSIKIGFALPKAAVLFQPCFSFSFSVGALSAMKFEAGYGCCLLEWSNSRIMATNLADHDPTDLEKAKKTTKTNTCGGVPPKQARVTVNFQGWKEMEDKGKDNGKDGTSKKKLAKQRTTKVIHLRKVNMESTFPREQYDEPPSPKKAMKAMKAMKKKAMKAMQAMKAMKAMKKG